MSNVKPIKLNKCTCCSDLFDIKQLSFDLKCAYYNTPNLRESCFYSMIKGYTYKEALECAIVHMIKMNQKHEQELIELKEKLSITQDKFSKVKSADV